MQLLLRGKKLVDLRLRIKYGTENIYIPVPSLSYSALC